MVSRRHVDATFGPAKMADFDAYAYPLAPNTYATWHEEPSKWVRKNVRLIAADADGSRLGHAWPSASPLR